MAEPNRKSGSVPWMVGGFVVVALYVGAYFATVQPFPISRVSPGSTDVMPWYSMPFTPHGWQNTLDEWLDPFFSPIHRLDRRVRPKVWNSAP